jgi:hypothetical protein
MSKRSALVIVCNGIQFIEAQLNHIYSLVDEIVIVEGADVFFQRVIKSKRSTDGTIPAIKRFQNSHDNVKLINVSRTKNVMVREGNKLCTGDFIYHVDVDEFLPHNVIESAFKALEKVDAVGIPMRTYFKWTDRYLSGAKSRGYAARHIMARFFRNRIDENIILNHIPNMYFNTKTKKLVAARKIISLPTSNYSYHYFAIFRKQLIDKMRYYCVRDGVPSEKMQRRIAEFDAATRRVGFRVGTYRGSLCEEENVFARKKDGKLVLV